MNMTLSRIRAFDKHARMAIALKGLLVMTASTFAQGGTASPAPLEELDRPREIPEGFREVRTESSPAPFEAADTEKRRGFAVFSRAEPGNVYPWSTPRRGEIVEVVSRRVARGEIADFNFAIYAIDVLGETRVEASAFSGSAARWPQELRHVHCWPQRTGWRSSTYRVIPELLVKRAGSNLAAGATQQYYMTVDVPANAPAGKYFSTIRVKTAAGTTQPLRLELEVLPFKLPAPDMVFGIYPDIDNGAHTQQGRELWWRLIARQGFTMGMIYPLEHDSWTWQNGKMSSSLENTVGIMEAYKKAGLGGPFIMSLQRFTTFMEKLGVEQPSGQGGNFSEASEDAMRQVIRLLRDAGAKHQWPKFIPHGVDEPDKGAGGTQAVWLGKIIREEGLDYYCTLTRNPGALEAYVNVRCMSLIDYTFFKTKEQAEANRASATRKGAKFWCYGTGCYVNGSVKQEGNLISNRYMGGVLLWRAGVSGTVAWTLMRPHDDPYWDFDGSGSEPKDQCTVYPPVSPDAGFTPTLQWEGLRKGIYDYKYLNGLEFLIKQAKESGIAVKVEAAERIERDLNLQLEALPWRHVESESQYPDNGELTNARLDALREQVVDWILELGA